MRDLRDLIVLTVTLALEVYGILLAGRYFGWNESTMNAWAAAGAAGLLVTNRYFVWWKR